MMDLVVELIRVYYLLIGVVVLGIIAIFSLLSVVMFTFVSGKKGFAWVAGIVFLLVVLPGAVYLSLMLTGLV